MVDILSNWRMDLDLKRGLIILLVGLTLRLIYVVPLTYQPYSDMAFYERSARSLADGEGFPAAYTMSEQYPAFIFFWAGIFSISGGAGHLAFRVVQAILGAFSGVLAYFLAKQIWKSKRLGLLAGLIVAVYPDHVLYTGAFLTETLYTFFLLCLLCAWQIALDRNSYLWRIGAGLFLGLSYLTRSSVLTFIPLAFCWEIAKSWPDYRRGSLSVLLILSVAIGVCVPWWVRNQRAYGTLFPPSHSLALAIWGGNNPKAEGYWVENPATEEQKAIVRTLSTPELRRYWIRLAVDWVKENPIDFIHLELMKISRLFSIKPDGVFKGNFYNKYVELFVPAMAKACLWFLVFIGAIYSFALRNRLGLLYAFFVSHVTITLVFFAYSRFLVPVIPVLAVLAAYGLEECRQGWQVLRHKQFVWRSHMWVPTILIIFLMGNWGWDFSRQLDALRVWRSVDSLKDLQMQKLNESLEALP